MTRITRRLFLTVLSLGVIYISSDKMAFAEESASHPQTILQENMAEYSAPCHMFYLRNADRYPASKVLHRDTSSLFQSGRITSAAYLGASFLPVRQISTGSEYIAFKAYSAFDFTEEQADTDNIKTEHVGYVRIDVRVKEEPYSESKHKSWPFFNSNNTPIGTDLVQPELFERVYSLNDGDSVVLKYVKYEECKVRWFIDSRIKSPEDVEIYKSKYPDFPFEFTSTHTYPEYTYEENQIKSTPTLYGYNWERLNHEDFNWDMVYNHLVIFGVSALPIVGTLDTIIECSKEVSTDCLLQSALDIGSDAIFVGKVFKVANLMNKAANASNASGAFCKVNTFLQKAAQNELHLKAIAVGDVTLAGIYAAKGEYLSAIASAGSGAGDLIGAVLVNRKGFYGGLVGRLEQRVCRIEETFNIKFRHILNEPPNTLTKSKFFEEVKIAQLERPGKFGEIENRRVYRLDNREVDEVYEAGGIFPNPNKAEGSLVDHTALGSKGNGSFVSTTTEEDIKHLLVKTDFFPENNFTNYPDGFDHLLDQRVGVDAPLPEPVIYEAIEYSATTDVTVLSSVDYPDEIEATARAMRLDEGLKYRPVTIERKFQKVKSIYDDDVYYIRLEPLENITVRYEVDWKPVEGLECK